MACRTWLPLHNDFTFDSMSPTQYRIREFVIEGTANNKPNTSQKHSEHDKPIYSIIQTSLKCNKHRNKMFGCAHVVEMALNCVTEPCLIQIITQKCIMLNVHVCSCFDHAKTYSVSPFWRLQHILICCSRQNNILCKFPWEQLWIINAFVCIFSVYIVPFAYRFIIKPVILSIIYMFLTPVRIRNIYTWTRWGL